MHNSPVLVYYFISPSAGNEMRKPDLLVLDADDTLWESARFFERAEEDFLSIAESLGHDPSDVRAEIHERDIERLSVTGYGAIPYLDTLHSILAHLCDQVTPGIERSFEDLARNLLDHPVLLRPGVRETLAEIFILGIRTVVYTMGKEEHQNSKYLRSGLDRYVNALHVVEVKTPDSLRELLQKYVAVPEDTILVGNSSRSDINPALMLGVNAIHVMHHSTWTAEREDYVRPEKVSIIDRFDQIIPVMSGMGFLAEGELFNNPD
jgi:putative hydrolase of the HAD superfamily